MVDAVRNIIIKLGRKVHSPETATKHVKTLLQLAMKKKLKLDPILRDEIMVIVLSDYPEFYADWSEEDTSELLLLASEASDEVSPASIPEPADRNRVGAFLQYFAQRALESDEVSRRRAAAQPRYLQAAQDEAKHRLEILLSDAIPSVVPIVETDNVNALLSVRSSVSDDPPPLEICPSKNPSSLPTEIEVAGISNPHASDQIDGVPVYTSSSLAEGLEHVRHFAGLPTTSIPEPYRVIHPTESSSEDEKILAKSVPVKVVVESGDDNLDVAQPEKKRKSGESVKTEANPPIQQVFKTPRSSVKQKGPAVVPTSFTRKGKPITRSRGRSITPEVQPTTENPDTSIYSPQFVSSTAQGKWSTMIRRDLIVQRSVDEHQLNSVCDILPLLSEVGLLKTVSSICPYSKLLTSRYEFYCNLNEEIDNLTGTRPMQIFIRGKWYVFGLDMINEYYGLKGVHEEEITDWDLVAKTLTGGQTDTWPTGEKDYLPSSQLTSKYVILHRPALHNWLLSAHFHMVGKQLAALLFWIGTNMSIDLGSWIYYHILTLIHPREKKVWLPFPNLIFGVLTSQGLEPMPSEVISPTHLYTVNPRLLTGGHIRDITPVIAPSNSDADTVADDSPHAKDVQLSLRLKARVSELETVHGIIAKQLTGVRTELAIVLLRLSLTESAATDAAKSDSENPSNA
ncbi:PREDICTED: uncharacterized protein LOC109185194 [Ipomoea nil]|uniref:uncharacterized protein LOC109185194 n=1 Tax=Ipomoea nil TaxID=35883 RepID=UPI000900EB09|nr:PREDICTED: uncharacterized protein LOC109185194 [Ipomoea nil]